MCLLKQNSPCVNHWKFLFFLFEGQIPRSVPLYNTGKSIHHPHYIEGKFSSSNFVKKKSLLKTSATTKYKFLLRKQEFPSFSLHFPKENNERQCWHLWSNGNYGNTTPSSWNHTGIKFGMKQMLEVVFNFIWSSICTLYQLAQIRSHHK